MDGWIKLYRKLQDNPLWTCEPFTRGQAWVDLILLANHEDGYFYLRDHRINVKRGQVGWSHLQLSLRWKWSRSKVKKFINDLEKEQQVVQQQSHSTSVITLLNYEIYQEKEQQVVQQEDNRKATEEQQKDTNKNDKNDKNDKNIEERTQKFKDSVFIFRNQYPEALLSAFTNYWTEKSINGSKMRFEKETVFEVSKRLITWSNNEEKFKRNGTSVKFDSKRVNSAWGR